MKSVIDFIKGSPIVLVSLLIVVACVAFLFLVVRSGAETFKEDVKKRTSVVNQIRQLEKTSFRYPDADPDKPYREAKAAINKATLEELDRIHDTMHKQYKDIFAEVANYNRTGDKTSSEVGPNVHAPMHKDLFPDATADDVLYGGKIAYLDQLKGMLGPEVPNEPMPRINAGDRHDAVAADEQLQKIETRFVDSRLVKSVSELSEADQKQLWSRKRERLHNIITNNARKIDVYATLDPDADTFPLHIGQWAKNPKRPDLKELWEGQQNLWIQQDILRAIQRANNADSPLNNEKNVMTNPVKHLLSIQVVPGYVGVDGHGAMDTAKTFEGLRGRDREDGGVNFNLEERRGLRQTPNFAPNNPRGPQANAKELVKQFAQSPDKPLREDFEYSATSRISNQLYDVRHARLLVIVDYRQLPILMRELSQVNLMTVLNVRITDVDEYQSLRNGYYYGDADAVEVELLIETIWLRDWTKQYMPEPVRKMLYVDVDEKDAKAAGQPAKK